jgi:metallo-beta-lactamase class B
MKMGQQIAGGIYLVGSQELSHPADCMVYAIDLGVTVLIDSGAGPGWPKIKDNMAKVGLYADNLSLLILTHAHIDHIGAAAEIKNETSCRVMAHELDRKAIETADPKKTAAAMYQMPLEPVHIDDPIEDEGERIGLPEGSLNLLHTPGHTPGFIVAYTDTKDMGRVLFGQDIHGPFAPSFGSNIDQWMESMELLLDLQADVLCEGHYGVVVGHHEVENFILHFMDKVSKDLADS